MEEHAMIFPMYIDGKWFEGEGRQMQDVISPGSGEVLGYSNDPQAEGTDSKLFGFELWSDGKPVDPEGYIVF